MNRVLALWGCVVIILALSGCGQQSQRTSNQPQENVFPEVMVGVWEAQVSKYSKWGIKFEPDGSILKIIHSVIGPVRLEEGGTYEEGPDPGTYAVFVMGPCEANYNPSTRMLKVKIIVDYYKMKLPTGELEGRIEDYFEGPVSEDGKTWKVEWRSYGWLEGADPPDIETIDANPEKLVFTKIDINSLGANNTQ
jgi:hypothetical protein